jgi:hypothetical protein
MITQQNKTVLRSDNSLRYDHCRRRASQVRSEFVARAFKDLFRKYRKALGEINCHKRIGAQQKSANT